MSEILESSVNITSESEQTQIRNCCTHASEIKPQNNACNNTNASENDFDSPYENTCCDGTNESKCSNVTNEKKCCGGTTENCGDGTNGNKCCDGTNENDYCDGTNDNKPKINNCNGTEKKPRRNCCYGPNENKRCFFAPNEEQGKCFASLPDPCPEFPFETPTNPQQYYTGGEDTAVGLAGGGKDTCNSDIELENKTGCGSKNTGDVPLCCTTKNSRSEECIDNSRSDDSCCVTDGKLLPDSNVQDPQGTVILSSKGTTLRDDRKAFANISVEGMTCAGCAATLETHVMKLPGVYHIATSVLTCITVVTYDMTFITPDNIVNHINKLTFTASLMANATTFVIIVRGMDTNNSDEVIRLLEKQKGVVGAKCITKKLKNDVPVEGPSFSVSYDPSKIGVRTICDKLHKKFPETEPEIICVTRNVTKDVENESSMKKQFWISLLLCIPIIISSYILPEATHNEYNKVVAGGLPIKFLIEWIMATPLQLYFALPIYKSAWSAARYSHQANMDTLIVLSTSIAYLYSACITITILALGGQSTNNILDNVFFETSALVLVLVLLGRYLELLARRKTSSALSKLIQLQPDSAILAIEDIEIPTYLIQRGDILKVLPGAKIPTDGIVVLGTTHVDESMLTGEPLPVKKKKRSLLFGGTVNNEGMITMEVTRIPGETELDDIAHQLEKTQLTKAKIEKITDKIASRFVIFVIILAVLVFVLWLILAMLNVVNTNNYTAVPFAMQFALAVLIVSCPCAIGLAAPTAVLVGSGVAAKHHHLLFKGGDTLEMCAKIDTVCFDKTGTLTEGKLNVIDIKIQEKTKKVKNVDDVLYFAASAELGSEHPIGRAIVTHYKQTNKACGKSGIKLPSSANIISGKGIEAVLKDKTRVHVGSDSFLLEKLDIDLPKKLTKHISLIRKSGATVVFVAVNGSLVGTIAVADIIKPSAAPVIEALKEQNINVWMLTGDHESTAAVIAKQLGIENVVADSLPTDKANIVRDLQKRGMHVAMLGDGVNDAIALSQADIGIAVGTAADLSLEVADVVMLSDNLHGLIIALDLSKTVYQRIKINLAWALIYNIIMLPLAAGVLQVPFSFSIPPAFAGLSEILSSIPVIMFSLLLRCYKAPKRDHVSGLIKVDRV